MTLVGNNSSALETTILLEKMCSELLTAEYVTLWRVNNKKLFSKSLDKGSEVVLTKSQGLLYKSLKNNESSIHNLLSSDKAYDKTNDNIKDLPFKDMLVFPILDEQDETIAILQACTHSNDLQQFTQNDLNVIESVSIFLAKVLVSIENDSLELGNRKEEKFVEKSEKIVQKLQNDLMVAEKKVEIRTQFLAEIAHEIRTPMHAMMGFIELLKDEETDKRKHLYLENAYKSAESMSMLLNDTLDFTKSDKGEMSLEMKESSLLAEMYSIVSMFYMKMKLSNIHFFSYIDPLIPVKIMTDSLRIRQVISNLLSNAIKFTPEGGKVLFEVIYDKDKQSVSFSVRDTGIGIAKENQNKIFSAYSQEKDSTAREYGGTGLGLSISLQLVNLLNSRLQLDSSEGEGSCFYFDLSLKDKIIDPSYQLDVKELKKHKPLLLFTKADEDIRDLIKRSYLRLGMDKTDLRQVKDLNEIELKDYTHLYVSSKLVEHKKVQGFLDDAKEVFIIPDKKHRYKDLNGKAFELEGALFAQNLKTVTSDISPVSEEIINNKTILTVDDNPINLDLMESILKQMGAVVLKANDGQDAIDIYKASILSKEPIDMIFMDQNMPNMNGIQAATAIKAFEKKQNIPSTTIIGLCGTQTDEQILAFEEAGMLDCLCKPVCIDTIKKTVVKYIEAS